jgi:ribonuclease G
MKPILLWDAGPGEIRAGLSESGRITALRLIRLRRNEQALIAAGERYTARIVQKLGNRTALVALGNDQEAVLSHCPPLPEGSLLGVEMVREPIPEPGRWKRAKVRPDASVAVASEPCWHVGYEPWEQFLIAHAPEVEAIVCPDAASALDVERLLGPDGPPVRVDTDAIEDADFDALIDQAVTGHFSIAEGMLCVERTRAMTMIDVDGTAPPLALNLSAARAIPPLLHLLNIGGPIGIDFLTLGSRAERSQVDAALAEAAEVLGPHERTAMNGFGFCQIIRPRTVPSVMEWLCGTTPGRRSLETRAIALLRDAGRSKGIGARHLIAPPAITDLIRMWPEELAALRASLGVQIELVPDSAASGYGQVHVSQS